MRRQHFLIIGAGRFGAAMAETLTDLGHEVVAVDNDEAALGEIADAVGHAAVVDATDERALARLGVDGFDAVVVAIGRNLEASILATVAAKSAGARHLISKADTTVAARVLASVGADEVVRPEHEMGVRLARQLAAPGVVDAFELGDDHRVVEVEAGRRLRGTLADLRLPRRYGLQVLAVRRGGDLHVNPGADFEVHPGDRLVVIGANGDCDALAERVGG